MIVGLAEVDIGEYSMVTTRHCYEVSRLLANFVTAIMCQQVPEIHSERCNYEMDLLVPSI